MAEYLTSTFDIPCSTFCGSEKVFAKPIVTMDAVSSAYNDQHGEEQQMRSAPGASINNQQSTINNPKGFTVIEIIAVLVVVGVLAAIAAVRFRGTSTISVIGAAEMIQADIRYAQEAAMAEHTAKSVIFNNGSSVYTFSPASGMDPLGELPSGVTIGNNFTVTFNSLGEPTAGGGGSVSVSADGQSKTISITNYTGKVGIE